MKNLILTLEVIYGSATAVMIFCRNANGQ